jgi:hypothetical protein
LKSRFTRRHLLHSVTAALVLGACGLAFVQPAAAGKKFDPNSPKGKWQGDFTGDSTGTCVLTISALKNSASPDVKTLNGAMKFGAVNAKISGVYHVSSRLVVVGQIVRKGTLASIAVTLSSDGQTMSGTWGTTLAVPGGGDNKAGTITLSRK